ncbi:MAG: hypothetical protein IT342_06990 [Candidatus Melainabacteria bacterium]|nr:hypothetical protein [Candidatus Melainabacteria bacterium]
MQVSSAPAAESELKRKSIWIMVLSSFTCWFVVCMVGLNCFIQTIKPLQYIKTTRYVPLEQNPLVSKLPAFFDSKERPQLLVLGSSLPMEAIARYDAEYTGSFDEKNLNAVRKYTGARYLEHLIAQKNGSSVTAFNLTCVACMASDAELILRRVVEAGRAPQIVVFGIGPRDFIDNIVPAAGKTPVCQLLSNRITLSEIFSQTRSPDETRDLFIGQLVYPYKVRGDYRTMLTGWACDLFSHPADLFESQQLAKLSQKQMPMHAAKSASESTRRIAPKPPQFADLPEWKERYLPANFERFEKEKASFQNMLAICKKNGIRMIVVNMPITKENRKLIPEKLYARYQNEICKMPAKFGDEFIDLDANDAFQLSDFYDSAHLNAQGGKKVQDLVVSSAKTLSL